MGIPTRNIGNVGLSKAEKITELQKKHSSLFTQEGEKNPLFIPKMFFGNPKVFYLFPSELKHGRDIYTESVDKEYNSEDETRTLYKWTFNKNYETQYATKQFGHSTDCMYIIPFSELNVVEEEDVFEAEFKMFDTDADAPISEMTMKDLYAMLQNKPVSSKEWLNKLIKS